MKINLSIILSSLIVSSICALADEDIELSSNKKTLSTEERIKQLEEQLTELKNEVKKKQ